jgi:hypothetical protein
MSGHVHWAQQTTGQQTHAAQFDYELKSSTTLIFGSSSKFLPTRFPQERHYNVPTKGTNNMVSVEETQPIFGALPTFEVSDHSAAEVQITEIIKPDSYGRVTTHRPEGGHQTTSDTFHSPKPGGQQRGCDMNLDNELRNHAIRHSNKNIKYFWPPGLVRQILTKERVAKELQAYQHVTSTFFGGQPIEGLADSILSNRLKLFAILILLHKGSCIEEVISEGLTDQDLPLDKDGTTLCQLYRAPHGTRVSRLVQCFSGSNWAICQREGFVQYQHALSPQYLEFEMDEHTAKHREYDSDVVLPFMNEEDQEEGGCGIVTKVTIHPACHGFFKGSHNLLNSVELATNTS